MKPALACPLLAALAAAVAVLVSREGPRPPDSAAATREAAETDAQPTLSGAAAPEPRTPTTGRTRESAAPERSGLRVRVTLEGWEFAGASVRVRSISADPRDPAAWVTATTNARGIAWFPGRDPNGVVVQARAQGFRVAQHVARPDLPRLRVDAGETLSLALERGVPLSGRVVDARSGSPVAEASVNVVDFMDNVEVGPTDGEGRFDVPGVAGDEPIHLVATARGHVGGQVMVLFDSGRPRPEEPVIRLDPGGTVAGVVVSPAGEPVAGATLHCRSPDAPDGNDASEPDSNWIDASGAPLWVRDTAGSEKSADAWMRSGADGRFRIDVNLTLGQPYAIWASAPGYGATAPQVLEVAEEAPEQSVRLVLRKPAGLVVSVRAAGGGPLPEETRVLVRQGGRNRDPVPVVGLEVRFDDLDPGAASVAAIAEGFPPAIHETVLTEAAVERVDLVLDRGAVVEGAVVDAAGRPVEGAWVMVGSVPEGPSLRGQLVRATLEFGGLHGTSDEAGRFAVSGLPPGRALLVAEATSEDGRSSATREPMEIVAPARDLRVVLVGLGEIRCRLVRPDGTAWVGRFTTWRDSLHEGRQGWSHTVEDGVVRNTGLSDGRYEFRVQVPAHAWTRRVVEIHDGSLVDLGDLVLDPGVEVSGRVVDSTSRPVAGADVTCMENEDRKTRTDAEGRFSFRHFPRERVRLRVEHAGHADGAVVVEPGRTIGLEAILWRPAVVRGVLRSEDGTPMPRTRVELRGPGRDAVLWGGTDGSFHHEIPPGTYRGYWVREGQDDRLVGEWTFAEGESRDVDVLVR